MNERPATSKTSAPAKPSAGTAFKSSGGGLRRLLAVDAAKRVTPIPPCPERTSESTWLCNVYGELTGVNLGATYNDTLAAYFSLEAAYGYANGTGRLATEHRPQQVAAWMRAKRIARPAYCGITDTTAFGTKFWAWWMGNQPAWRETTGEGRPGSAERKGESWGGLVAPGVNGMLTAVVMLYWWGCEDKTRDAWPTYDWVDAVLDVGRVCESLRDEAEEEGRPAKKPKH
ncbi:hypothetical protein C8F01DRAFT_991784 [Mycena amicta]|nr:hypothetical protein C8F01DRAFT_996681 [Mycena amicta]KAJ7057750.1 hypothetical protein C8F01DRAFT_991784 [Mycena amicta]